MNQRRVPTSPTRLVPGANDPRKWQVERVSEGAREPIAHGVIPVRQDIDDTAIAIATKVGRVIKRGLPQSQACWWIDITTPAGRRFEPRYAATGFDWDEMRAAIYELLYESGDTALIHRGQRLHITIDSTPETESPS